MRFLAAALTLSGLLAAALHGQARGGNWNTSAGDAQRTAWVGSDARLTKDAVKQGDFQFLWKAQFENEARQLNSLTEPILQDLLIGYRGFKALAFVGGSDDRLFAIDTDLARPYWTTHITYAAATGGQPPSTPECPGGLMATPSRRTALAIPAVARAGGGSGARSISAVGEPGRGAAVLSEPRRRPATAPPPAPSRPAAPRVAPIPFGGVDPLYVMGSDGFLRTLRVSDGAPMSAPVPFLPPSARPSSLTFIDGVIYTTTSHGCGAAPNGVWALDLVADNRITMWSTDTAHVAGRAGPAFGPDGTLYVATSGGASRYSNAVVALDRATLAPRDWFAAEDAHFNASPVLFRYKDREYIVASGGNGRFYLLGTSSLGGTDHRTPLHVTATYPSARNAGGLASWEEDGTRWIVATTSTSLVAFKLLDEGGRVTLAQAWQSRALPSPLPPLVVNGMVFAASSGDGRPAGSSVLHVLDATTGRQMWTSGRTITSFARAAMAAGSGQVYLVTHDNHLYAFGIPMEH